MAKYSKQNSVSKQSEEEAYKLALGIQKPGQTKEQTKLIAQGISKGIDLYKKQQKAKAREQDKARKKEQKQYEASSNQDDTEVSMEFSTVSKSWIPWGLLILSWLGFAFYFTMLK